MNWNEEWDASIRMTSRERLNSGSFWDERAHAHKPSIFADKMTDDQLSIIGPEAHHRILEIGPGNGRLTIPLAKTSSDVTIVDPSTNMLEIVRERSLSEGLTNVRAINDKWDSLDIENLGKYNKLVSSYSLFMYGIEEQIARMNSISDNVYLFVPADIRIPFDVQKIMFGQVCLRHTDFEIITEITKKMGLRPNTDTIRYPREPTFDTLESAVENCLDYYNVPEDKKDQVTEHVSSMMVHKEGKYAISDTLDVGVIWWQKG